MASNNLGEIKANMEQIFADTAAKLEDLISQYRTLLISNDDDPLHERLFAFCSELEALKKKISNKNAALSVRIESIGNVSQYLEDFMADVADYKETSQANTVLSVATQIEVTLDMLNPDATVIEDSTLKTPQNKNEAYFKSKQSELEKMVANHPELG